MTRRRGALLAVVVAAVVVAGLLLRQELREEPGRLVGDGLGTVIVPARGGERLTDANVKLVNEGTTDVVITRVDFATLTGIARRDVEVLVAGAGRARDGDGGAVFGGPEKLYARDKVRPAVGFVLRPASTPVGSDGGMMIFTLTVPPARSSVRLEDVRITYRAGREEHVLSVEHGLLVCAAPGARCDPERPERETPAL